MRLSISSPSRFVCGSVSRSSSKRRCTTLPGAWKAPVALPPGRLSEFTRPTDTGSETEVNTTGTVSVSFTSASAMFAVVA